MRRDLLDTYDARLRTALAGLREADALGYATTRVEMSTLARGYWTILAPTFRARHGASATRNLTNAFYEVAGSSPLAPLPRVGLRRIDDALAGFRAAPLSDEELRRRAGQLERFLRLVPIEYGRGVENGRVTLDFEIQEADDLP